MTIKQLQDVLKDLIKHMGLKLESDITQDGDLFLINITGPDTGLLERGRDNKPQAFLTVLKLIAKQKHGDEPRIVLDFHNQRKQRLENVAQMARKMAEMVRIKGNEEELPPMGPAERRAVHMALKEMTGIKTESKGVEPHRRIVIMQEDSE